MGKAAQKVSVFGLLTALTLVLGLIDRQIPLSALLGGGIPGIKLGLANTVLLYAVCLMGWRAGFLLMLAKVLLSGLLYGSPSAMLYSLSGGLLSLAVMLIVRHRPVAGALGGLLVSGLSEAVLLIRNPAPRGQMLWCVLLIGAAFLISLCLFLLARRRKGAGVIAISLSGAVAHNAGQVLAASLVLNTPRLLTVYLPVLAGVGVAVGCLTGLVARQVFRVLRLRISE